jgi:hypothetical protein
MVGKPIFYSEPLTTERGIAFAIIITCDVLCTYPGMNSIFFLDKFILCKVTMRQEDLSLLFRLQDSTRRSPSFTAINHSEICLGIIKKPWQRV